MSSFEFSFSGIWKTIVRSLLWGIGAMIIGGLIDGWTGIGVALSVLSYWKISTMALANPVFLEFMKSMEKLEKRQTINRALLEDLEKVREEFEELKEEMNSFQSDIRENMDYFRDITKPKQKTR